MYFLFSHSVSMNFMRDADEVARVLALLDGPKSMIHTGPAWEQIKHLPVEALSEIFILVVKSWSSDPFASRGGLPPPMQLAQICRAWRQIAFSTPLLWTSIRIVLPTKRLDVYEELLREWIARSAGCPLDLKIYGDDLSPQTCMKNFRPIFTLLLQSRNRWSNLVTMDFKDLLAVMLDAKYDFPSLRELYIFPTRSRRVPFSSPWPFKCCPRLRKIRTSMKHSDILIDWNTIEELDITVNIVECLSYLNSSARTITKCNIELQNCWNRNIHGLNSNIISLPCVTTLSICVGELDSRSDVFIPLISRLSLPALRDLNIVVGDNINIPWIPEFIRLILRSSWKLLKLDISACSAIEGTSETQILEMLSHLPTLEHLSLDPQCKLSPKFFTAMDLSKTPAREALLPALRVLNLYHAGPCTIYAPLICMLESRVPSNSDNNSSSPSQTTLSTVQQLVSVTTETFIDDEEDEYYRAEAQFIKAKILSLESKGTKLVINCSY
jgi:hypothetical protein